MRSVLDTLSELRAKLAEGEELGTIVDQSECGDVPECGGSAVAQNDFVAVRQREKRAQARTQAPHLRFHGLLAMRGAQIGRSDV